MWIRRHTWVGLVGLGSIESALLCTIVLYSESIRGIREAVLSSILSAFPKQAREITATHGPSGSDGHLMPRKRETLPAASRVRSLKLQASRLLSLSRFYWRLLTILHLEVVPFGGAQSDIPLVIGVKPPTKGDLSANTNGQLRKAPARA